MAGIDGSGPIRLGSNSAQIPVLLAKTKPQPYDRPQQEAVKNLPTSAAAANATPQSSALPATTTSGPANALQMQVKFGANLQSRGIELGLIGPVLGHILCCACPGI